jgi:superfamily I DNA and/or RNA helicase
MKREMYDFVISDESSQLLLSHSIGALQRGSRSIICGDPEQMAPGSYFKKKQETEMSLLHHAYYHLPKVFLSNHYRSLHPKLIKFSNEHFYNNRLLTFQKATQKNNPIFHHFIENGIYKDRQNIEEAKAVATQVSKAIKTSLKIGVVAFSEVQLALILSYLNPQEAFTLRTKIDENKAFTHALENVQGDECDLLIISMGYGYNENGKFEMRFGPINNFGGHKSLMFCFRGLNSKYIFTHPLK